MVLVITFAYGIKPRHTSGLVFWRTWEQAAIGVRFVIDPESAHAVMDRWENLHWLFTWIDSLKLFIYFENATKLAIELRFWNVG